MTDSKILKNVCAELSQRLHRTCNNLTPADSKFPEELQAIVCGSNFSSSPHQYRTKLLGLIHIFVVSGAHFTTLQILIGFLLYPLRRLTHHFFNLRIQKNITCGLELLFLVIFLFATGLCAPALRSFYQSLAKRSYPWINSQNLVLASGLACVFTVSAHDFFSLQLSWLCALVISIPIFSGVPGLVVKGFLLFIGCSFLLAPVASGSLLCVLSNLFLAPVISLVLFPLGLGSLCFSFLVGVFDFVLNSFFQVTSLIAPDFFLTFGAGEVHINTGWLLLGVVHFLVHFYTVGRIRAGVHKA